MKKLTFLAVLFLTTLAPTAHAVIVPFYADIKLGSQLVVEKQAMGSPAAADTTSLLSAVAGPTSAAAASITSFAGQPDVPRNLVLTPVGTTGDVEACTVTIAGTNIYNKVISEDFAFLANASTATVGAKAFKTVTSVSFPANCESGGFAATWSLGKGEKLGLKYCLANAGEWLQSSLAGAHEATLATVVANATAVESNTADFAGTMNGSNALTAYFFQNFQCKP